MPDVETHGTVVSIPANTRRVGVPQEQKFGRKHSPFCKRAVRYATYYSYVAYLTARFQQDTCFLPNFYAYGIFNGELLLPNLI